METKFIFVTGGVVSSLGKGITAASLGRLLKDRGLRVTIQKFDPYINVDPGTMSPYQHGEVYVTDDGAETDLDLGHYERFIDENLTKNSSVTTGKVYWSVINKERRGDYGGKTVQVIPHITNEIKKRIIKASQDREVDIVITEVGGTVGDIESLPFLEAIRQIKYDVGKENVMYIHVTLIPYLSKAGELKTKPTQHSVKELRSLGIQPDALICRCEKPLSKDLKDKIALFCDLDSKEVIENRDVSTIYQLPQMLEDEGLGSLAIEKLNLQCDSLDLSNWNQLIDKVNNLSGKVDISLVGKYIELKDAYLSVIEALKHGGLANGVDVNINWLQAEEITKENAKELLGKSNGILVPGGFGDRGIEGKITAIKYARENNIPYFGICLGMQLACIEFSRNVVGLKEANSTELNPTSTQPVIHILPDKKDIEDIGGTLRLGSYSCVLEEGSKARSLYDMETIHERHRHRYEFNNDYKDLLQNKGLVFSGMSPDGDLVEIIELKDHPFFIGVQFHPEFKSRPTTSHPIFKGFIKAAVESNKNLLREEIWDLK